MFSARRIQRPLIERDVGRAVQRGKLSLAIHQVRQLSEELRTSVGPLVGLLFWSQVDPELPFSPVQSRALS